jgi:hypothetical protein
MEEVKEWGKNFFPLIVIAGEFCIDDFQAERLIKQDNNEKRTCFAIYSTSLQAF